MRLHIGLKSYAERACSREGRAIPGPEWFRTNLNSDDRRETAKACREFPRRAPKPALEQNLHETCPIRLFPEPNHAHECNKCIQATNWKKLC